MTGFDELSIGEARALWERMEPAIERALSRNGLMSEMLRRELKAAVWAGVAKVIMGERGFGIVFQDGNVLNLVAYSGTLAELRELRPKFVAFARSMGCNHIRITGSRAWMKAMPGLQERAVVMELSLD